MSIVQGYVFHADHTGSDGWSREKISSHLQVPGDVIGGIFPPHVEELCVSLLDGDKSVGHCNSNVWGTFLDDMSGRLEKYANHEEEGVRKFVVILKTVLKEEIEVLLPLLEGMGFSRDQIAHNCGLMVMKQFEGQGWGSKLLAESIVLRKEKGFKVVVVKTTNVGSARVMEKNGFTLHHKFHYNEFGVEVDDFYSIYYKVL